MREKVMSLAQGKFTYQMPEIICSIDRLTLEVTEGGEATSVFRVSNAEKTKIKGFGAVEDFNFEFLPVFDGKDNEITVKVHATNRRAGETMSGELCLITDCGEYMLPYEIHVVGKYLDSSQGKIQTYEEFLELARKNFEEAVSLFYHDKFKSQLLKTFEEKRLYQDLTMKNPKKQALEEFLVAHGDKKPVQFMVNKKQLSFEVSEEDIRGQIVVAKDSWGMVGMKVVCDSPLISVDKGFLYDGDFSEDKAAVEFHIQASKVPSGIHQCEIVLENVYQRLEIKVRIHGIAGREERNKKLQTKKLTAHLTENHIQYMMNSSLKDKWIALLQEKKEQIILQGQGCEQLLEGYLAVLSKDERGKDIFVNTVEGMTPPEVGESPEKVMRYLAAMYIRCRAKRSDEETGEFCEQLVEYYTNGYRHWKLLVMLERLGYYQENSSGLLEELDRLWEEGSFSPYQYLYRMMLILQDPELLKKLDSQTIATLRFGLKHGLITEDTMIAVSFLAARQKRFTPALFSLLEKCYEMFENNDTLHSICTLLIRSEKLEDKYFCWFRLGVEKRLRITELFEYYMYTMGKGRFDEALPEVMTYFQYENHLRDSVKVSFYARIVKNREEHPEYFQIYSNAMREFTLKQLYEHRISPELAILYEAFLGIENCKDRIAKELPYVLFAHHIKCTNKNMERVVVIHDEGMGEMIYNLSGGEADILIATPNYKIYFVDKNGFYHGSTISYQIEKILNLDIMAEACYENGSEYPFLLLHLFSKALHSEKTGSKEAILLHMMVRDRVPGVEYTEKALWELYEYYKAIGEEALLEEVVERMDFRYLEPERRAGVLQTMIQHKMNDKALEVQKKYEITNCSLKLLLLLITWKLEESEGKFEPYHMRLCSFLYHHGIKNKTTLGYLVDYYMGRTSQLFEIYKDALRQETDISDGGTERLLGQTLFVGDNPEKYSDIFLDYYEYGANRILVKAFLGYTAYEYLVGRCKLTEGIREKIQKEALSEDNHIMILAMLRYYAGQSEYTESEREYIEYHLARYASTGRIFAFMKEFVGKAEVPFAIEHTDLIQIYSSHKGEVYIELQDENGEKMVQPMRRIFEDIYIYETLLFWGEALNYRIFAGDMEHPVESGVIQKENVVSDREMAFYDIVNDMIEAQQAGDMETYRSLVDLYKSRQKVAEALFAPL